MAGNVSNNNFYAHSCENDPSRERWQRLEDHLAGVGELAREFAAVFGAAKWGEIAGRWHDLGKGISTVAVAKEPKRDQNTPRRHWDRR